MKNCFTTLSSSSSPPLFSSSPLLSSPPPAPPLLLSSSSALLLLSQLKSSSLSELLNSNLQRSFKHLCGLWLRACVWSPLPPGTSSSSSSLHLRSSSYYSIAPSSPCVFLPFYFLQILFTLSPFPTFCSLAPSFSFLFLICSSHLLSFFFLLTSSYFSSFSPSADLSRSFVSVLSALLLQLQSLAVASVVCW